MLKKSKSMSNLTKVLIGVGGVLGAVELANEGAGLLTNADTWYKGKFSIANAARHIFGGDNMKPEEKHALARKILDVIDTFDISEIGKLEFPEYKGDKLNGVEKESYDKKYNEDCDNVIKGIKDKQGNSYTDRVDVKRYELGGVSGGVTNLYDRYRALRVLNCGDDVGLVLDDLADWDFKNEYDKLKVAKVNFAKNRIQINYEDGDLADLELQEDGKLKVQFVVNGYKDDKKLITEFTLEKPKNEKLKK